MAFVSEDRVKETSSTTGTGDFTLDGAATGFKAFSEVCSAADTFFYAIVNNVSGEFEIGEGTFTAGGALQRDTVLSSSNSDAAVNFGSGTKDVFITAPADSLIQSDTDGEVSKSTSFSSGTFFFNDVTFDGITTGRDIVFDRSVNALEFRDNASAVFGTGSDFSITHDGFDTYLNQSGTGELRFGSSGSYDIQYFDNAAFRLANNFELQFGTNNSFEMEYNSIYTAMVFNDNQTSKDLRFQQAGSDKIIFSFDNWEFQDGVQASFGNGSDFSIVHDGTDTTLSNSTGVLNIDNSTRDVSITGELVVNETQNLRPINMQCFVNGTNVTSTNTSLYSPWTVYTPQRTDSRFNVIYMPTGRYIENSDDPGFYARLYYRSAGGSSLLMANEATDMNYLRGRWSDRGTGNYMQGTAAGIAVSTSATGGYLTSNHLNASGQVELRIRLQGVGGTGSDTLTLYGFQMIIIESAVEG